MTEGADARLLNRFVILYALAWGGGTIGYIPLLSILLPLQVADLTGKAAGIDWLAWIALAGAVAASAGGILFGYLSDITGNRRGWIAAGLAVSTVLLLLVGQATTLPALIATIVAWQLALNMMLGPLAAWAGDVVPDRRKGVLGGLMAFAPALGAAAGALVTQPGLAAGAERLGLVGLLVCLAVLPVLLSPAPPPLARTIRQDDGISGEPKTVTPLRMWLARLSVQIAEAALFAYLLFWLVELDPQVSDNQTARLFTVILLVSAPVALLTGRWSDRADRPILPLRLCAVVSAAGLVGMATASSVPWAIAAYGLFGVASAVFLALHSAQTLRVLPRADRRGRDLGLFNLANTIPSLVMPWLVLVLVPTFGFAALFVLLAGLSAIAAVLLRTGPKAG